MFRAEGTNCAHVHTGLTTIPWQMIAPHDAIPFGRKALEFNDDVTHDFGRIILVCNGQRNTVSRDVIFRR